jgi:hypothetical protein
MHPGTTRGLGDWTMVKEAIRIAHSDCGVAKFASSGRLLASNETPFDRKNSSFWIWMTCPMLFIHPPQPKYTSRDKKMSGPLSPEYGTYQNTSERSGAPGQLRASPCIEYCTEHDAHELYGSVGASNAGGWSASPAPRSTKGLKMVLFLVFAHAA